MISMTESGKSPITKGYEELVADAKARIEGLTTDEALEYVDNDDFVFVDLRTENEIDQNGKIPNAVEAPRGLLEFHIDPNSPVYKSDFEDYEKLLLYCQKGWRSPLAAQRLQEMGLESVAHLESGFTGWKKANGPVQD